MNTLEMSEFFKVSLSTIHDLIKCLKKKPHVYRSKYNITKRDNI